MKTHTASLRRIDILGNGSKSSDQEIFTATLKRWRRKLGYCSIFATVPAMLVSHVPGARADDTKKPEVSVAGRTARPIVRSMPSSNPALLKRQSNFLLPHQKGNFAMLAAFAGSDDCPGSTIPGGNYTAAAPYVHSDDTTGANDTVTRLNGYYYYYNYDARGPDQVYSFTLTARGPNPQIEVSTTSGTYRPLIYVLQDGSVGACPAGTGNTAYAPVISDSRWGNGSTATLDSNAMNYLPLNVPLHLFVDSAFSDSNSAGSYTIRMQDVTIAPTANLNPIDSADVFVRQHYRDFLNREPDSDGLAFWTREITSCGSDQGCIEAKRINDSASFFLSIEFQESGYLVYRFHKSAFGNLPGAPVPVRLSDFLPDAQQIGKGVIVNQAGWQTALENNKQTFAMDFVQRPRFVSAYPTSMSSEQFVDALFANAGVAPSASDRTAAINEFAFAATTADVAARARALRRVAENSTLAQQEFDRAFVLMQYFGYLRRNPNDAPEPTLNFQGYDFWLNKLDSFSGNYIEAEMVKAFLSSGEYRQRFGP
jgi:hypothetical protein